MAALLTYRSRDSFESRFGRNIPDPSRRKGIVDSPNRPETPKNEHFHIHNEGHRNAGRPRSDSSSPIINTSKQNGITPMNGGEIITIQDPEVHGATPIQTTVPVTKGKRATTYFSAQSYLRYQGDKFIKRFDANCYIAITRKLDTHDLAVHCTDASAEDPLRSALGRIEQPTLVLGIKSDGLFTYAEQQEIGDNIPNATLHTIESPEGHDAFLLQFEQVNKFILDFFQKELPEILAREPVVKFEEEGDGKMTKNSTFGEAEVEDITEW